MITKAAPRIHFVPLGTACFAPCSISKSLTKVIVSASPTLQFPLKTPIRCSKRKKVYSITGPQASGVVLIGNDYLFKYDQDNNFVSKEKVHNSLIRLPAKMDSDQDVVATMHSHVISDIIDPTDICTLLLYRDYVPWRQHYVFSKKFVSIFDMDKENLVIVTRKAWDKMNEDKQ